jgi:hypothetical protein
MFPLWFALLGGSFVFLDVGPSILFLVFPLFWVLWFIYDWQGFIENDPPVRSLGNFEFLQNCEGEVSF